MHTTNDHFEPPFEPPAPTSVPPEEDDPWGFNTPPSATEHLSGKKKKGKKKVKKNATAVIAEPAPAPAPEPALVKADDWEGDESPAYPSSDAPGLLKDQVVLLQPRSGVITQALATSPLASDPLVNFDDDDDDDTTAVEDVELVQTNIPPSNPPPPVSMPITKQSAAARSPPPAIVEPVVYPATSPLVRPATIRDRQSSFSSSHRPTPVSRTTPSQPRRESFATAAPFPRFVDPPPPHLPQAHFFSLPDIGLNLGRKQDSGKPAGSEGYCCSLDSLADAGHELSAKKAKDALLVGSEGGIEVYRILPNKLEVVGRLEGLKGAAMEAKIIPCTDKFDPLQALRPLIAVVIHGPVLESEDREANEADAPSLQYQTTVDIFSLQTQVHIATLYKSAVVTVQPPAYNTVAAPPGPIGDLRLHASGSFITVTSGQSGEVFVFTHIPSVGMDDIEYRCIGKFWTSLQKPVSTPARTSSPAEAGGSSSQDTGEMPHEPLISLNQRWMAIVPPMLSSDISISGTPLLSEVNPSPPGLTTHIAPQQPMVSCEVAGTDVEGAWIRLGRQAAQGLVKYSQRGIQMGLQGWKELTHPAPHGSSTGHHARSPSKEELFPPTKGPAADPARLAKEPAVVSIVDLHSLLHWEEFKPKHLTPPMATFALVDGCNFLSLSSTGTRLLTASRKGEVSLVWDLAQVAHGVVRHAQPDEEEPMNGPCIKQLHRIARSTPSTVLACAWSRDDDALALLTAHGTVHLHEIPARAASKKRKRRSTTSTPTPDKADATTSLSMGLSPPSSSHGFLGSIKSSWQNVSTQVNSMRAANPASALGLPTTFAGFREATAAAGNAGSRAVARGLSQGYTAAKGGASDYWHAEDNKIRHKGLQDFSSSTSFRWIKRHNQNSLAIACAGTVHVHPIQRVERSKGDEIITGLKSEKYARKGFPLPHITTRSDIESADINPCDTQGPHGFWSLRHSSPPPPALSPANDKKKGGSLVKTRVWTQDNDVETNPPYCPFHVDARVDIFAFDDHAQSSQSPLAASVFEEYQTQGYGLDDDEPWTFGAALPPSTKVNERDLQEMSLYDDLGDDKEDDDEDELEGQMESKLTIQPSRRRSGHEQIRINTRRRSGKDGGNNVSRRDTGAEGLDLMDDEEGTI